MRRPGRRPAAVDSGALHTFSRLRGALQQLVFSDVQAVFDFLGIVAGSRRDDFVLVRLLAVQQTAASITGYVIDHLHRELTIPIERQRHQAQVWNFRGAAPT